MAWQPSRILNQDLFFPTFDLQITPMLPAKFQVSWPFGSGEEAKNKILKIAAKVAILDYPWEQV